MKKLSLSNLSRHALDKFLQNSLHGGDMSSCICAYICDSCKCSTMDDGAVRLNSGRSEVVAEVMADMRGDSV